MQVAVFLLYANVIVALLFRSGGGGLFAFAVFSITRGRVNGSSSTLAGNLISVIVVAGSAAAAYLIANEKKIGWRIGVVVASAPVVALLIILLLGYPDRVSIFDAITVGTLFDVALVVLLLHDQTRSYEKVWFK
jgi:hypothetical protein